MIDVVDIKRFCTDDLIEEEERAERLISPQAVDPESKIFLCDDHTVGFVYECQPLSGGSNKEKDKIDQLLGNMYPSGTSMSFLLYRSPDIEEQLRGAEHIRLEQDHPLLRQVFASRMDFLREHTTENINAVTPTGGSMDIGRIIDLKLIVSVKIPFKGKDPTDEFLVEALQWNNRIISGLTTVGFAPRQMGPEEYIRFLHTFLNWNKDATWRSHFGGLWERDKPISAQIFDPNTAVISARKDLLQLGDDCFVKVLSAKKLPDSFYFGESLNFIGDLTGRNQGIQTNYAICCNIFWPDTESMKSELAKKRQWSAQQAYGPLIKFEPIIGEVKESFDIIYQSLNQGARPLKMSYSLILFGKTEKEITSLSAMASPQWSTLRFKIIEDKYVMLPIFINCLPLCMDVAAIRDLYRYKTLTSMQASAVIPIFGEGKGVEVPHVQLISRNGQLMNLSLHSHSATNQNAVIAAESGSGKSFLLNEIILSYMSVGAQVWVIDAGKSYKKLCDSLGGDFVQFGDRSGICLNPFQTIEDWEEDEDAIHTIVTTMASASGKLSDLQSSMLKTIMREIWNETMQQRIRSVQSQYDEILRGAEAEKTQVLAEFEELKKTFADNPEKLKGVETEIAVRLGDIRERRIRACRRLLPPTTMSVDMIADRCKESEDMRIQDIGNQLEGFTSRGSYGRYFNGLNNASFKSDLTVLELDELQGRHHLRQVVLLQLISQIQREIFLGDRGRKRIVVIDEAWDLLKEGEVARFMEHAYRKFRKYGGSAIIATQSIQDLYSNEAGVAIANNSANMFLLAQKATTIEQVKKDSKLVLDEWGYQTLKSVHTEPGIFSEVFMLVGPSQAVGRLVVSDFQKLLYSTTPKDVADIQKYQDQGCSITDAINAVLRDRGISR